MALLAMSAFQRIRLAAALVLYAMLSLCCILHPALAARNDEYRLMDEVSFIVGHRGGRKFAEEISILPPGTINEEVRWLSYRDVAADD